jgi:F-type H+-transporting ATPase subunit alpha
MGCRVPLRGKVNEPLMTGLRVVDTILPIGRGQRQLIIGDRFTGKTSIYITSIINNNRNNFIKSIDGFGSKRLYGVYIAINQNLSRIYKITYIFDFLNMNWYNIILATHTTSPAMLSYLIPYNGTAIAEYLRDNGYDVLICYDDFSKHAKVYRQISLIQGRVPGRDAYPADIFNIHAALLERAGKIKWNCGNGSITAFPIIETINCDVTEYIATNLISITDGQIYTNINLFKNGYRPAVDSSLSVSRVGSSAQFTFYKKLVGTIKNDLTNYRQLINYAAYDLLLLKGRGIEYIYYQD